MMRNVAKLIPAKCPSCGAGLTVGAQDEVVRCAYCHASAFVKRPGSPLSPPPHGQPATLYVEIPSGASRPGLAIAAVVAVGVLAVAGAVVAALANSHARAVGDQNQATRAEVEKEAARLRSALEATQRKEDAMRAALAGAREAGAAAQSEAPPDPHRAREEALRKAKSAGIVGSLGR